MNVDTRKHLKPGPVGNQPPIGAALREVVSGRFDQVPDDMGRLLRRLERPQPRRAA